MASASPAGMDALAQRATGARYIPPPSTRHCHARRAPASLPRVRRHRRAHGGRDRPRLLPAGRVHARRHGRAGGVDGREGGGAPALQRRRGEDEPRAGGGGRRRCWSSRSSRSTATRPRGGGRRSSTRRGRRWPSRCYERFVDGAARPRASRSPRASSAPTCRWRSSTTGPSPCSSSAPHDPAHARPRLRLAPPAPAAGDARHPRDGASVARARGAAAGRDARALRRAAGAGEGAERGGGAGAGRRHARGGGRGRAGEAGGRGRCAPHAQAAAGAHARGGDRGGALGEAQRARDDRPHAGDVPPGVG